jgi:hypothetical protein
MKNSGPFRLKAGEFRDRAQSAESPLARQRLEDAAKRFDSLADEIDGAVEPARREERPQT